MNYGVCLEMVFMDRPFLVEEIRKMGYKNVFALEYAPTLEPSESLRQTLEYLKG